MAVLATTRTLIAATLPVVFLCDQVQYVSAQTTSVLPPLAPSPSAAPPTSRGLHSLFVAAGKLYFGNTFDVNVFNDSAYQAIADDVNEFGMVVPENSQKWGPIQPTEGDFQFGNTDAVLDKVEANGQMFRCHALTWHSQLPTFVQNGTWTRETLTAAIQTHISTVVTRYKSQCYSWDVVNEALNENGTFRDSVFLRVLGTDYLPISFLAAAEADPSAKLYYNDFNLETSQRKADGAARIVQIIRDGGARIDGLGFQAHLRAGITPTQANLTATLKRFTDLGLEVTLSELDIALNITDGPPTREMLAQQAADYVSAVGACLAVPKCVGITVWQFTDKYSWIPGTFPGLGDACLYTSNFTKKPAYFAVENLLISVAESVKAVVSGEAAGVSSNGTINGAGGNNGTSSGGFNGTASGLPGTVEGGGVVGDNEAADAALRSGGSLSRGWGDGHSVVSCVLGVMAALVIL
ncbi:Glycoside hydrolase superfamily [Naviculisporaceae sp. PSN 640]